MVCNLIDYANGQLIGDNKVVREPKSRERYGNTVLREVKYNENHI